MCKELKQKEYNQSFSSLWDQLSILTWVMSPLVIYILLCVQTVNICLFYNEKFGPELEQFNPLQNVYGSTAHTVLST